MADIVVNPSGGEIVNDHKIFGRNPAIGCCLETIEAKMGACSQGLSPLGQALDQNAMAIAG
jgi:hypothetical protein